ncbi:ABC-type transport auxiliary lipoprotein family protein [Dasania marina]|uniref:ABC-type transport auxiliary lipoprotein family protein n=1 Tax=Dasania marina TaxID=471499 RepID=UPI0004B034A6|nr:ABC-type transport auxiliary lipoprotein family protein [Dasania marina]
MSLNNKKSMGVLRTLAIALPITLTLSGCINLPEHNNSAPQHYSLLAANSACQVNSTNPVKLAITRVAAGLESDRIIQSSALSGEIIYLSNMRWPNNTQTMLEQRLAQDLENAGFSIITSHKQLASNPQLNCELRALNLVTQGQQQSAVFALSCALYKSNEKTQHSILVNQQLPLPQLSTNSIAIALSQSYNLGFEQLCDQLKQALPNK